MRRWLIGTALALGAVHVFGAFSNWAARGLGAGQPAAPPVYGTFEPRFGPWALIAVAVLALGIAGARTAFGRAHLHPAAFLAVAVAFLFVFAAAAATVDGSARGLTAPLERTDVALDYHVDVPLVSEVGARRFIGDYPDIVGRARSIHTKNHPPGPVVLVWLLEEAFPRAVVPRAAVLALLSALVLVPAWFIARRVAGEQGARLAVGLLAVAPAPVLMTFVSLDAVFATVLAAAIALLVAGLAPGASGARSFAAGAAVGLAAFMTYAAVFVAAFGVLYAVFTLPWRDAARALAGAAAGGVAALIAMRLALGFDLLGSYRAGRDAASAVTTSRPFLFWLVGNFVVWLSFAGVPLAAGAVRELVSRRPLILVAAVAPLVLFYLLPWSVTGIIPGETERTLQFAYPVAAAAAAGAWLRSGASASTQALLLGLAGAQTIAFAALFRLFW